MFRLAKRLQNLPPYPFAQLDEAARRAQAKGLEIVSMGIGDPDNDPPEWIRELLVEEVRRSGNHRYPSYKGHPRLCDAALAYLERRFGVKGLGHEHICTTIGSKEGLANLAGALLNPEDHFIAPDPTYPVFPTMGKLLGAREITVPVHPDTGFMPDLNTELSEHQIRCARVMYVNYPHNPTAQVASREYLQRLVDFACEHNIVVVSDLAYAEIYYDEGNPPASLLQFDGALECVIEFHSFSKTFNMTGWRCGFAVGDANLIRGLTKMKTNLDSGVFDAIQLALARALGDPRCEPFLAENRKLYLKRRDKVCAALDEIGLGCHPPGGAIYVWCELPAGQHDSMAWCSELLDGTGLVVSPGAAYGHHGEGFFRLSLTTADADIDRGLELLAGFVKD
jgi:LL-diaminopimelate aminotransferase